MQDYYVTFLRRFVFKVKRLKPTLNAGSGAENWGDVRVDVERGHSFFFPGKSTANMIADVQHLPFRNQSFSETRCFHVLEHTDNPRLALSELRRVSAKVVIRVPVWHLYSFLIEASAILAVMILNHARFLNHLREIKRWKKRYGTHKWYVHFKNASVNRWLGIIPREQEKIFLAKE
jgi:hypothetical protein